MSDGRPVDGNDGARVCLRLLARPSEFVVDPSGERGAGRRLALLTYAFLAPAPVTRDELCDVLWDAAPGGDAQHRLRQLLFALRKSLPPEVLKLDERFIGIDRSRVWCDVAEFRRAATEGRLPDAAALYEADFLAGASLPRRATGFEEWVEGFARALQREHAQLLRALIREYRERGDFASAAKHADRLWGTDPDDDTLAALLLESRLLSKDHAAALDAAGRVEAHFVGQGARIPRPLSDAIAAAREAASDGRSAPVQPMDCEPAPEVLAPTLEILQLTSQPEPFERERERGNGRGKRSRVLTAAGALTVLWLMAAALALLGRGSPSAGSAPARFGGGGTLVFGRPGGRARALRVVGPGPQDTVGAAEPLGDSLLVWRERYSVARRAVADACPVPETDNRRVCIRSLGGGRELFPGEGGGARDDGALGWSPDGEWVLVRRGSGASAAFTYDAYAVQAATGRVVQVTNDPYQDRATWSPDGTRLVVLASCPVGDSMQIRTVDGAAIASYRFAGHANAWWSPDGETLLVSATPTGGMSALWIVRPGSPPRLVSLPPTRLATAAWSPDGTTIAVGGMVGDSARVVVCRPPDCLHAALEVAGADAVVWLPERPVPYVDTVRLIADSPGVLAGESLRLQVRVADGWGRPFATSHVGVRVDPPEAGWVDSSLALHPLRAGTLRVIASAGGWRADTLAVNVRPAAPAIVWIDEDWSLGLDAARWKRWGAPLPTVVPVAGERVFRNNGDDNYPSGVVSRSGFPLGQGVTLEWRQQTPLTGDYWQEQWIDFSRLLPDSFRAGPGEPYRPAASPIGIRTPILVDQPPKPVLVTSCGFSNPPYPPELRDHRWHTFIYQLHPDRTCEFIVDGRLLERGTSNRDPSATYRLVVGGRTYRTNILVGPIRLWRGVRWGVTADGTAVRVGG